MLGWVLSTSSAVLAGVGGEIYVTADRGKTWQPVELPMRYHCRFASAPERFVALCGKPGSPLRSYALEAL